METIAKVMWKALGFYLQPSVKTILDFVTKIADLEEVMTVQPERLFSIN